MKNVLLNDKSCDQLSTLRGVDLLEVLETTENSLIEYRDSLRLPGKVTFGVEIEYEGVNKGTVTEFVHSKLPRWESKGDGSLDSGGELNSPILIDEKRSWEELRTICEYLKGEEAVTSRKAGGHIHVGAQAIGSSVTSWRIFTKLYMLYEDIFTRFFYGDKTNARPRQLKYAPPINDYLFDHLSRITKATRASEIIVCFPQEKYSSLKTTNISGYDLNRRANKNTLELRSPNATVEEVIWQNNINAFTKMLTSSKDCAIDERFLDYKMKDFEPKKGRIYYDEVQLKRALEFVDMIFDNNLDKMYFLRQYIKSFEQSIPTDSEATFAKSFIK